jgi:hypothetical protein
MNIRIAVALAAMLALSGCAPDDPGKQAAQCELDAMRVYPGKQLGLSDEVGHHMRLCMRAAGFEFNTSSNMCAVSYRAEANPACYAPVGPLAKASLQIQSLLR